MPSSTPSEPRPVVGIVLAAGRGQRLRPLTDTWAKPVLPFLDRPLIAYALDALLRAGVRRIGVNAWHLPEQVVAAVAAWRRQQACDDLDVTCRVEPELLGTGGGARGVWEHLGSPDATAVVINGDLVTDVDLRAHLEGHRRGSARATLLVTGGGRGHVRSADLAGEGGVWLAARGARVLGLPGPDGPTLLPGATRQVSFAGVSLLEPSALEILPSGPGCLLRQGLTPHLLAAGAIRASASTALHLDVGSPARYWAATRRLLEAGTPAAPPVDLPAGVRLDPPVLLDATVVVAGPCRLGPFLVAGQGARFEAGAMASEAVIWGSRVVGEVRGRLRVGTSEVALPV